MWTPSAAADWQAQYLNFGWDGYDPRDGSAQQPTAPVGAAQSAQLPAAAAFAWTGDGTAAGNATNFPTAENNHQENEPRVPTAAELPFHMARCVEQHGVGPIIAELSRCCTASQMQAACDLAWGVRSDDTDEQWRRVR